MAPLRILEYANIPSTTWNDNHQIWYTNEYFNSWWIFITNFSGNSGSKNLLKNLVVTIHDANANFNEGLGDNENFVANLLVETEKHLFVLEILMEPGSISWEMVVAKMLLGIARGSLEI